MKEEFKTVCNNTTQHFNAIIQALQLPRRVNLLEVTRLLSFIDSIIDYYIQLGKKETTRYPIIYIPCAKDWVEEVCLEFVMYKIESFFDSERMQQLDENYNYIDNSRRHYSNTELRKIRKWWRDVAKPIVRSVGNNNKNVRNLIVCGKSACNRIEAKQELRRFLGKCPKTSITCSDAIDVEERFLDYQSFENIFCFYSNNGICDTYESNAINWPGLKNCFIFEFDYAPYCLHNVLRDGERLCEKFTGSFLLSRSKENIYPDYITLTSEEAHYLFNEKPENQHEFIPFPEIIEEDREFILELYKGDGDDESRFSIKDRNILSLCLCDEAKSAYIEFLKKEKPIIFEDSMWKSVLNLLLENMQGQGVVEKIMSFVDLNRRTAFVICDTPDSIKKAIKGFFDSKGLKIKFYKYKNLKDKTISEKRIIILRFCPHNISSQYYSYKNPNSFDEYLLKKDQTVLDIINEIAIIDYSKYKYDYDLHLYAATKSAFRREKLGGELEKPQNPNVPYVSHYNSELDDDACEQPQANTIPTVKFEYSDGTSVQLPENEVLVCENNNGDQFIERIRDLKEHGQLNQIRAVQPIYELADETMNVFFNDERQTTTDLENILRNDYVSHGLIPADHNCEIPIWKFLLDRKIRDYCVENGLIQLNQHEALWSLLRNNLEDDRIQNLYKQIGVQVQLERVLRNWCDTSVAEPIIPGMKRDREKIIISFLGLNRGMLSLYRKKQLLTREMTRTRNRITEGFLCRILFDDITDELAAELLEDSQYAEYLAIDTREDIETLKAIALEHINLRQIKTITI